MNTCHAQWSKFLPPTMSICLRAVITSFIFNKHKQTKTCCIKDSIIKWSKSHKTLVPLYCRMYCKIYKYL